MKIKSKKIAALLLAVMMIAAFVPSISFAADSQTDDIDQSADAVQASEQVGDAATGIQQQSISAYFDKKTIYVDGEEDGSALLTVAPEDTVKGVNVGTITVADISGCVSVLYVGESVSGKQYKITALKAGTGQVTVTASGNEQYAPAFMTYSIKVVKTTTIKSGNVKLSYSSTTYNGKAKKPTVTVKVSGKKLKKGTNYTVSYADNKVPGTATVTVKGKTPNYTGTVKKTFTINKASQKISVYLSGSYKQSALPKNKTNVITIKQYAQKGNVNAGEFTYKSSNTSVLTCNRTANHNCNLNSRKAGTARVTIYAGETKYYKSAKKTLTFKVVNPTPSGHTYTGTFPTLPSRGYFKKGDSGTQVYYLQKFLKWAGYPITTGGTYGDLTVSVVKQFQRDNGLTADGLFGKTCLYVAKNLRK